MNSVASKVSLVKTTQLDRRSFLTAASASAAYALLPDFALGRSRRFLVSNRAEPIRIRGRVVAAGRGLSGVAVTDGLTIVDTDADGAFDLPSSADRSFVYISLPSGYRIPRNPTGTARFYEPITADVRRSSEVLFQLEPLSDSDERHALLLLADVQTQDLDEARWFHEQTVSDLRAVVAELDREVFGAACGDIMYDHLELYPEYEDGVRQVDIPFFQVLGNHDMDYSSPTDRESHRTFSRHFGPPYYSFNRGAVHYVVLDDVFWHGVGYFGYLTHEQLIWLAADLDRVEPGSPVIVALHIPVLGSRHLREGRRTPDPGISVTNRAALYELLQPFDAHILAGHTHESEHVFESGVHEHVSGAVCGAWWSGPICGDGTPSGYSVYEIAGETVTWRYKATGHPFDHQIRMYPRGADPGAPDEMVANIWDWDPAWSVVWYEDGERKGAMSRRVGFDPLSVELHSGPDLPERRPWVEPLLTGHLFYAPVSVGTRRAAVEATDRFGRVYSAELEL